MHRCVPEKEQLAPCRCRAAAEPLAKGKWRRRFPIIRASRAKEETDLRTCGICSKKIGHPLTKLFSLVRRASFGHSSFQAMQMRQGCSGLCGETHGTASEPHCEAHQPSHPPCAALPCVLHTVWRMRFRLRWAIKGLSLDFISRGKYPAPPTLLEGSRPATMTLAHRKAESNDHRRFRTNKTEQSR